MPHKSELSEIWEYLCDPGWSMEVLGGKNVPKRVEVPVRAILPRGCETPSINADNWAEMHVEWEQDDDAILSRGPVLKGSNITADLWAGNHEDGQK